ncbi:response regulator FixJ [Crenalkalicoccus roseus]|uniref:response regulator FixJ n=1 Tax=Crenalkalicoccus roseus TaxID=1485588 RepID=UPI00107FDCCD|nr:response regulator FixJ [Crenalkalicoccus roseus]
MSSGDPEGGRGAVHVVDDDEAVRRSLAMLLRSAGMAVRTHPSALAFLDALPSLGEGDIGCVLTDVRMPGMDGLQMLRQLRAQGFAKPVIVMTAHGDIATAVQAMKAGALDFIEKPFDDEALLAALDAALAAPAPEAPPPAAPPADPAASEAAARIAALSPREREVLELLTAGKPNKVIAHELGISPRTVEVHRARMMERLGARSLAEAVRLALRAEQVAAAPRPPG